MYGKVHGLLWIFEHICKIGGAVLHHVTNNALIYKKVGSIVYD